MKRTATKTGWVPSYMIRNCEVEPHYQGAKAIKVTYQIEEHVQEINLAGALRAMADGKTVELYSMSSGSCGVRIGSRFSIHDLSCLDQCGSGATFAVVE